MQRGAGSNLATLDEGSNLSSDDDDLREWRKEVEAAQGGAENEDADGQSGEMIDGRPPSSTENRISVIANRQRKKRPNPTRKKSRRGDTPASDTGVEGDFAGLVSRCGSQFYATVGIN